VGPLPRTEGIGSHLGVRLADRAQLLLRAHTSCESSPRCSCKRAPEIVTPKIVGVPPDPGSRQTGLLNSRDNPAGSPIE